MVTREAMRDNRGAVAGESEGTEVIPNTIPGGSMVLLSRNFPRTFPFQSESRRGGNPNGFLASIRSKLMRPVITVSSVPQFCRIESPQDVILSGAVCVSGVL